MDYDSALGRLFELVDHERMSSPTKERVRYDLRRMELLLRELGDPHRGIPTIHIAGTKGKGSTAAMVASVLSSAGYRIGLYISPHLHTFRERISMDGAPVSGDVFAGLVEQVWPALKSVGETGTLGEVTVFEALTAMAFCHFRERAADFQVLEVGLGGRLDTTNLVDPLVCVITSLSLDHTSILGDKLSSIATEKAGIIKASIPVVAAPQPTEAMEVLEKVCRERAAPLIAVGDVVTWDAGQRDTKGQSVHVRGRLGSYDLRTSLLGDYQLENAAVAVGIVETIREAGYAIEVEALQKGLATVSWPCRLEVLQEQPLVVCDGAHNRHSVMRLRDTLPGYFSYDGVVVVFGTSADKDLDGMAKELAKIRPRMISTRSRHPRAASSLAVAEAFEVHGLDVHRTEGVDAAIASAIELAGPRDMVLVTGSLFVAAEAREASKGIEPEAYPQLQRNTHASSR